MKKSTPAYAPILKLPFLGATEYIELNGQQIPAKIDTGADSSSIWASDVSVNASGQLEFKLFASTSPFYTGEVLHADDFKISKIRSSNGQAEYRYRTHLSIILHGKRIRVLFSLSNRSKNQFPVLIGRRTIKNKFLVDVSKSSIPPSKQELSPKPTGAKNHQRQLKQKGDQRS